jgi:hypothetical protein
MKVAGNVYQPSIRHSFRAGQHACVVITAPEVRQDIAVDYGRGLLAEVQGTRKSLQVGANR